MYSANLLVNNHRAKGRKAGESRDGRRRGELEGVKERASQMSLYSAHTDGDKTRMSEPKERATAVEMCQDPL